MSSDETQSALSRAYELIEAGNYGEARAILDPILAANKNDADAWWIYAHAVTDADAGRDALENVVRINPQYPGASELLAQARDRFPARPKITSLVRPVTVPEAPPNLPEISATEPARDTREQAVARAPRRSVLPLIAVLVVIVVVAAGVIFLITQNAASPIETPTSVAIAQATETVSPGAAATTDATVDATSATEEATVTRAPTVTPTGIAAEATSAPTAEATIAPSTASAATQAIIAATAEVAATVEATAQSAAEFFADIELALAAFPLAESGVGEVETSIGNTLLVTACTTPGRAMRTLLPQVMNALALKSPSLNGSVEALGVRMLDCSANTPLLTVAVDLATAERFAEGALTSADFAASWQPQ